MDTSSDIELLEAIINSYLGWQGYLGAEGGASPMSQIGESRNL